MNSEQDCKNIRQRAIGGFCHDFGGIFGVLGGCSDFLNRIAIKDPSFDDIDVSDIIEMAHDYEQRSESLFTSMIDYMKSNSENCEALLSDIIELAGTTYQEDFKIWYVLLKQLEEHYIKTKQLDTQLTHQLIHHANNLSEFRQKLLDGLT